MKNNNFSKNNKPKVNNTPFGLQLPIQLEQENGSNLWTWRFKGIQMRNHFASGFWYSEDGKHVFWAWQDLEKHLLTSLKEVKILSDASGRLYVEVKRTDGKVVRRQNVDEAVCVCFHARCQPNQRVSHKDGDVTNNHADNLEWE